MFREHIHEKTDFFEEFILKLKNDTRFSFINFEKIKKDKSIKSALRNIFISTKELNGFYDSKNKTLIYPLTVFPSEQSFWKTRLNPVTIPWNASLHFQA